MRHGGKRHLPIKRTHVPTRLEEREGVETHANVALLGADRALGRLHLRLLLGWVVVYVVVWA